MARAQATFNWKMTSFYGPNAAFYSTGPGSAKDLVKRIDDMHSEATIKGGKAQMTSKAVISKDGKACWSFELTSDAMGKMVTWVYKDLKVIFVGGKVADVQ